MIDYEAIKSSNQLDLDLIDKKQKLKRTTSKLNKELSI
jgi:hypothetical protein